MGIYGSSLCALLAGIGRNRYVNSFLFPEAKPCHFCRFLPCLALYFWTVAGLRFVICAVSWMVCVLRSCCIFFISVSGMVLPGVPRRCCLRMVLNSRIDLICGYRCPTIAGKCVVTEVVETCAWCAICFNDKSRHAK